MDLLTRNRNRAKASRQRGFDQLRELSIAVKIRPKLQWTCVVEAQIAIARFTETNKHQFQWYARWCRQNLPDLPEEEWKWCWKNFWEHYLHLTESNEYQLIDPKHREGQVTVRYKSSGLKIESLLGITAEEAHQHNLQHIVNRDLARQVRISQRSPEDQHRINCSKTIKAREARTERMLQLVDITQQLRTQGQSIAAIATRLKRSTRTIYRYLSSELTFCWLQRGTKTQPDQSSPFSHQFVERPDERDSKSGLTRMYLPENSQHMSNTEPEPNPSKPQKRKTVAEVRREKGLDNPTLCEDSDYRAPWWMIADAKFFGVS